MTLHNFGTNNAQKRRNMTAVLKFKMATEDAFGEKKGLEPTQILFANVFGNQKALIPLL